MLRARRFFSSRTHLLVHIAAVREKQKATHEAAITRKREMFEVEQAGRRVCVLSTMHICQLELAQWCMRMVHH